MSQGCVLISAFFLLAAAVARADAPKSPLDFQVQSIDGKPVDLAKYKGKVLLIVNTASECGYTGQYANLEAIYRKYKEQGLAVLGFPANEFGQQEPGTNREIASFCQKNYGVDFDMFAKSVVDGPGISPLYAFLTSKESNPKFGGPVGWNFEKFLIGRDGQVVGRFAPDVSPDAPEIVRAIESELAKK